MIRTWKGWSLTTEHSASSYNQPVLVDPNGVAYSPQDLVSLGLNDIITVSEASELLGVSTQYIRSQCAERKYICRKSSDGVWLILKSSVPTKGEK